MDSDDSASDSEARMRGRDSLRVSADEAAEIRKIFLGYDLGALFLVLYVLCSIYPSDLLIANRQIRRD